VPAVCSGAISPFHSLNNHPARGEAANNDLGARPAEVGLAELAMRFRRSTGHRSGLAAEWGSTAAPVGWLGSHQQSTIGLNLRLSTVDPKTLTF